MLAKVNFTEINIQKLFGSEAAEDEDPKRLREYYFKSYAYDQMITDLPVRILVGHKGIGKSALIKVAMAESKDRGYLSILIQPDDILDLGVDTSDFLRTIRNWKEGIIKIVLKKVFLALGVLNDEILLNGFRNYRGSILDYLTEMLQNLGKHDYDPSMDDTILNFMQHPKLSVFIDDLDRGWMGRREDITRISALLNAVRDLSNQNRGISFKVALRSDVY